MEQETNTTAWMHMMDRPTFCVSEGVITHANQAALGKLVPVGQPVAPLLVTGQAEYAAFTDGWLALTIRISEVTYSAAVHRIGSEQVFTLDPDSPGAQLQAMALAAQKLRDPLSSIIVTMDRMLPGLEIEEGTQAAEQAAMINRNLHRMMRIIGNMTDAPRYCTEPPRLEMLDVNAVLEELFERAAALCEAAHVSLRFTGLNKQAHSLVDPERLERSVYHILSNALKVTQPDGQIDAKLTQRDNRLYLTVQDSGCGMDLDAIHNIFSRFLREPSLEDGTQGIGLGMTMIRRFAISHGGTVVLEPAGEHGLRLTLSIPIRLDTALHSPVKLPEYNGGHDTALIELSDSLPYTLYAPPHDL